MSGQMNIGEDIEPGQHDDGDDAQDRPGDCSHARPEISATRSSHSRVIVTMPNVTSGLEGAKLEHCIYFAYKNIRFQ